MASGLRVGSRGKRVARLQQALGVQDDGIFGRLTESALADFFIAADSPQMLGMLSRQYESAGRGVATISSGRDDPGGVSYGAHQLASKPGTMAAFIASPENSAYAADFENLVPGTAAFDRTYRRVATSDANGFEQAQHRYISRTHYEPLRLYAQGRGFDLDDRGIQEAIYSQAVQHSGAGNRKIVNVAKLGKTDRAWLSPAVQIEALYAARGDYARMYVRSEACTVRYAQEVKQALRISYYYQTYHKSGGGPRGPVRE